jgi:uncharacterized protein (DUF1810 family)
MAMYACVIRSRAAGEELIMTPNSTADPFDLERFVAAQAPVIETVLDELRQGRKRTHWIWFVFPQVDGLGRSTTAQYYAIRSRDEATAYLGHPVLGPRLVACTEAVLGVAGRSAHDIFGSPDDLKFRSSLTLFDSVGAGPVFRAALDRFYGGIADEATLAIMARWR